MTRVLKYVLGTLAIPLIYPEIKRLQREIWRVDQKVNRHLRAETASNGPEKGDEALVEAYPYLRDFASPWSPNKGAQDGTEQ